MSETREFWNDPPFVEGSYPHQSRPPLPSGPVEEFTQTPGAAEVIRVERTCDFCAAPILDGHSYASVGGNIVPYLPAKLYHLQCVPKIKPQEHPPVTELAAEVGRTIPSDPQKYRECLRRLMAEWEQKYVKGPSVSTDAVSQSVGQPTPYSDKSPISFYSHNQAEIDRLRAKLVRYQSRIERIRDLVKDLLAIIEVDS